MTHHDEFQAEPNPDLERRRVLQLSLFGIASGVATTFGLLPNNTLAANLDASTPLLKEPPVLASSEGVLQATLKATTKAVSVAGQLITSTMTYNGHYPGPTLRVKPGDHIRLKVLNNLNLTDATPTNAGMSMPANSLNTHFHGLHVSPLPKADYIYLHIPFGDSYDYDFQVPPNHPGGLYWYHPHVHGVVDSQIYAGLAGMLVVEGGAEQLPALQGVKQRLLGLKNIAINNSSLALGVAPAEQMHTVNGQLLPTLTMRPGETQLWRVANLGNEPYYKISLDGHHFTVVAEDGAMLWESYTTDSLLLPPGKRFEFAVTGGKTGRYFFKTQGYNSGPFGAWNAANLANVVITGKPAVSREIPTYLGEPPAYLTAPVVKRRYIRFSEGFNTKTNLPYFEINGKTFEPLRNGAQVKLNTTEEWLIYNDSNRSLEENGVAENHPFHIHVNNFIITEIDGVPVKTYGTQDIANVLPGQKVLIRLNFADFVGKSVFHCHIAFHEDYGMMANFEIVP